MKALTIRQPYAWAIAAGMKPVENRTWNTYHEGPLAIHAAAGVGAKWEFEAAVARVADLMGYRDATVLAGCQVRGAVVAVARLADVCSAARYRPWSVRDACDCGPWAVGEHRHFKLAHVRPLPEPVPVIGSLGLWRLPVAVESAVRAQLGAEVTR